MQAISRFSGAERNPAHDDGWDELQSRLPELDQLARQTGALRRVRRVRSGEQLLRLVLTYVTCWFSLRDTAAWARRALGIQLTNDALAYRFSCAVCFVRGVVETLLQQQLLERARSAPAVRILDATALNQPGTTGTDRRLHVTYTPGEGLVGVEMTEADGGEHLSRAMAQPGDLVIVDRGYGHASDVRTALATGEEILIRVHLQTLAIDSKKGKRMSPKTLMRAADARGVFDAPVLLPQRGHDPAPARLLIGRLPPEKAAKARKKVRRAAAKKGRVPDELALKLAGYFCCITSVPAERLTSDVLFAWYRIRWQIELWFKRAKSLLGLDRLTKASAMLVAIQIWGRLLVALLIQKLEPKLAEVPTDTEKPPISQWRLTRVLWLDVVLAVYGGSTLSERLDNTEALEQLREHPRKRSFAAALVQEIKRIWGGCQISGLAR